MQSFRREAARLVDLRIVRLNRLDRLRADEPGHNQVRERLTNEWRGPERGNIELGHDSRSPSYSVACCESGVKTAHGRLPEHRCRQAVHIVSLEQMEHEWLK